MRILNLIHEFPPLGGGGGRVAKELARELVERGHCVDFLSMRGPGLPRRQEVGGSVIYRVPAFRSRLEVCHTHEMLSFVASGCWHAQRLVAQAEYDLCHAHFILPAGIIARALHATRRIPFVVSTHGSDLPDYNPDRFRGEHRLTPPLIRAIARAASGVVAPSRYLAGLVTAAVPGCEVEVVPHGADVERFPGPFKKEKRILVVTRMLKRKGVQYLLEAVQGLDLRGYEIDIVGEGPYRPELERLARGSAAPIRFRGWLDGGSTELRDLYERSSIFVMTSEAESFGMVLLDAMSAGLAIVTADGTGCREVIDEETALLVPPRDGQAIRRSLEQLVADPRRVAQIGAAGRRRAKRFDWPSIALRYEEIFARAIEAGRAS